MTQFKTKYGVNFNTLPSKKGADVINYRFSKKLFNPLYFVIEELMKEGVSEFYIYGGKSSAKSFSASQIIVNYSNLNNLSSIAFRKQSTTIKTTLKRTFESAINLTYKNGKPFEKLDFSFRGLRGNEIILKGLDNEEKAKGVENFAFLLFDELNQFEYDEYIQALGSFRGGNAVAFFGTWNPISDSHWVKTKLVDAFEWKETSHTLVSKDSFVKKSSDGAKALIKTDYLDNYWTVGSPCGKYGFIDTKLIARYDQAKQSDYAWYNVNVLGNWGHINVDDPFFTTIKPYNFGTTRYNPNHSIKLSFDFNKYATCIVSQHYTANELKNYPDNFGFPINDKGGIYFIEELKFYSVGEEFLKGVRQIFLKYKNHKIDVTGDKTGNAETTGKVNQYITIQNAAMSVMGMGTVRAMVSFRVKGKNLNHDISRITCNAVLGYYDANVIINEAMKELKYDIEIAETNADGGLNKDALEKSNPRRGDLLDCFRYNLHEYEKETFKTLNENGHY